MQMWCYTIVCYAVLGYIDNNLKTRSTRYGYGIEHPTVASRVFQCLHTSNRTLANSYKLASVSALGVFHEFKGQL